MGDYKAYSEKKQMLRDAKLKEYLNQQQEIRGPGLLASRERIYCSGEILL